MIGSQFSIRRSWRLRQLRGSRAAALSALTACAMFSTGCDTSCSVDSEQTPVRVESGYTENGFYESSAWHEDLLSFPPQRRYQFIHGLGAIPKAYHIYVSFWPQALVEDHSLAEAAGNIAVVERITDEFIQARNDTCETFYIRLVAEHPSAAP